MKLSCIRILSISCLASSLTLISCSEKEKDRSADTHQRELIPTPADPPPQAPPSEKSEKSDSVKMEKGEKYPFAKMDPDNEGFAINPYTQNKVDVMGIPSGTLIRDPLDPNPKHKFRVP